MDATQRALVDQALAEHRDVVGAYSIGGGNRALGLAFASAGRPCHVLVAHDLDADNLELLQSGSLTAVLHHDLHTDARNALRQLLRHHRLVPGAPTSVPANVEVVTRFNLPARLRPV